MIHGFICVTKTPFATSIDEVFSYHACEDSCKMRPVDIYAQLYGKEI